jgi:hypothetical protein
MKGLIEWIILLRQESTLRIRHFAEIVLHISSEVARGLDLIKRAIR